jgi:DNA-binding IscR family transcriptional regulator
MCTHTTPYTTVQQIALLTIAEKHKLNRDFLMMILKELRKH